MAKVWIEIDDNAAFTAGQVLRVRAKALRCGKPDGDDLYFGMADYFEEIAAALQPTKDFDSSRQPEGIAMRPEVRAFAVGMELAMRRNDHKGGFADMHPERALVKLAEEVGELAREIFLGPGDGTMRDFLARVQSEAFDVGVTALMVEQATASAVSEQPNSMGPTEARADAPPAQKP